MDTNLHSLQNEPIVTLSSPPAFTRLSPERHWRLACRPPMVSQPLPSNQCCSGLIVREE